MGAGTDKILTFCGVVSEDGKILPSGRKAFVSQVVNLLTTGNIEGKGLLLAKALDVAMPPIPGIILPAPSLVDPLAKEPIFHFGPDPTIALSLPYLLDEQSMWNKIFVDGLYATIAKAMNVPGSYVPPLFDPTIFLPNVKFDIKVDIPTLAIKIPEILLPELPKLLPKISLPALPQIPSFTLPEIPFPPIPPAIDFGIEFAFPKFFLDLILKIPTLIIPSIPISLPDLLLKPFNILLDIFLNLMLDLKLILVSPKLLMATMLVILQNIAVMIGCDIVGLILGTGAIVKGVSVLGGLSTLWDHLVSNLLEKRKNKKK